MMTYLLNQLVPTFFGVLLTFGLSLFTFIVIQRGIAKKDSLEASANAQVLEQLKKITDRIDVFENNVNANINAIHKEFATMQMSIMKEYATKDEIKDLRDEDADAHENFWKELNPLKNRVSDFTGRCEERLTQIEKDIERLRIDIIKNGKE